MNTAKLLAVITADELPTDYFDYDGALEDLREMYERGRKWIADNISKPRVNSAEFMAVYEYTLEVTYLLMAFREVTTVPEAL